MLFKLAIKSLLDRKGSVLLSILAVTVSIFILISVEHIRQQSKASFSHTVSGVDLIVGARTGQLNLLLYSVFRIGNPSNNVSWKSYQTIANHKKVKWSIPLSLGDSHKGYRVLGTSKDYFEYFKYGKQHSLTFSEGKPFDSLYDVVLGSYVAQKLGYKIGDRLVLSHGIAATSFTKHDKYPFVVAGILAPTGTPVDQTLHVSLAGIEAIHASEEAIEKLGDQLTPKSITAFMIGLNSKMAIFSVQRAINQNRSEPLMAILPGVVLSELWSTMATLEQALQLISILVFFSAALGVSAMLMSSIRERKQEIHLLRVLGAPPHYVFILIQAEAVMITLISAVLAVLLVLFSLITLQGYLVSQFGLSISTNIFSSNTAWIIGALLAVSLILSCIPAMRGYGMAKIK